MAYTTIDDPSQYFHIQLYTGNGTAIGSGGNAITNNANSGNFKPDWTWHKVRSTANDHQIYDSSRGVKIRLNTNATNSDFTLNEGLQSFDTNGFTVGSDNGVNQNSQTFVAWQWKANGGTTSTNSDGSKNTIVQANTTAGFSIVTYSGPSGSGVDTRGHGLGAVPAVVLIKGRGGTENWVMYHHKNTSAPETDVLKLNLTNATADESGNFNDTAPTSTVFTSGDTGATNEDGNTYVAYCFAEKQGYSKFGSYTGNGNNDGPFVYTGFKPAWVLYKRTNDAGNWRILDNKRNTFNVMNNEIYADLNNAEAQDNQMDFLSNGFKLRNGSSVGQNGNGSTYIYMAFAEHSFVSSEGVPTTAR